MAQSQKKEPKAAASVILLREAEQGVEVYLLRRHRKASFMASSFVFPGGMADTGDGQNLRITAIRELFEESGVLLSKASIKNQDVLRNKVNLDKAPFLSLVNPDTLDQGGLQYYSHWITPSIEKRRFSATFYLASMPDGQIASPDNKETVDEIWIRPEDAIDRAAELNLPPPQLRMFMELEKMNTHGISSILNAAKKMESHPHPILPRSLPGQNKITLLMPWDPQYKSEGSGESRPMPTTHPLAWGPTRFELGDTGWQHVYAPAPKV